MRNSFKAIPLSYLQLGMHTNARRLRIIWVFRRNTIQMTPKQTLCVCNGVNMLAFDWHDALCMEAMSKQNQWTHARTMQTHDTRDIWFIEAENAIACAQFAICHFGIRFLSSIERNMATLMESISHSKHRQIRIESRNSEKWKTNERRKREKERIRLCNHGTISANQFFFCCRAFVWHSASSAVTAISCFAFKAGCCHRGHCHRTHTQHEHLLFSSFFSIKA